MILSPAPSTPTRPFHPPGATGSTPLAKRPALLVSTTGPAGPIMSASDMNEFVNGLHYNIKSIGVWATNLHETSGDHAGHIEHIRTRAATSFKLVEIETDSVC